VMRYIMDNDIPGHVQKVGAHLMDRLLGLKARHEEIIDVRGRGLLAAIEFSEEKTVELLALCLERGLLLNAVSPTILRLFPALTITKGEIDEAMEILEGAL